MSAPPAPPRRARRRAWVAGPPRRRGRCCGGCGRGRWRPAGSPASVRTSCLVAASQGGELGVRRLRLALAVVAGDLGDDLDLERRSARPARCCGSRSRRAGGACCGRRRARRWPAGPRPRGTRGPCRRARAAVGQPVEQLRRRAGRRGPSGPGRRRSARRAADAAPRDVARWCSDGARPRAIRPTVSTSTPSRSAASLNVNASMPNVVGHRSRGSARRRRRCRPAPARARAPWLAPLAVRWRTSSLTTRRRARCE